jgi:hypothetical protein
MQYSDSIGKLTFRYAQDENANLNTLYIKKEQLQALWESATVELMQERLEAWCRIADQSAMLYLKKFARSLRNHRVAICNYAKHRLTGARIEAGNISIGMIAQAREASGTPSISSSKSGSHLYRMKTRCSIFRADIHSQDLRRTIRHTQAGTLNSLLIFNRKPLS